MWTYLVTGIVILVLVNIYFWRKTLSSLDKELSQQSWLTVPKKEYVHKCYDFIADHYVMQRHSWARIWKNIFYTDYWKKSKSIPCHMYSMFFNYCLRKRFTKKEVKLKSISLLSQLVFVHFYTKVLVNGNWINVDSWGKKRGIPFGETIHMSGWKR